MQEHVGKAQTILTFFLDEILIQKKLDQVVPVLSENLIATIPGVPGEFCDKRAFIGYLREVILSEQHSGCTSYQISSVKILPNEGVLYAVIFSKSVEQSSNFEHTCPDIAYFKLVNDQGKYYISSVLLHQCSPEVLNLHKTDHKDQYRRLVESTGTTIFEYNMDLDEMELFLLAETSKVKSYRSITIKHFSEPGATDLEIIHPADRDRAIWFLKNRQPLNGSEMRFRVAGLDPADYYWHEVYGSVSRGTDGRENRYIGMLRFVDTEKKRILDLTTKAERDSLTKLYNKLSVEQIINQSIENNSSTKHAFLLLDIDHFKIINDSAGHPFGDLILKLFARLLTETFRTNDIIGRIGGDEFVVFMRDIRDSGDALEKAGRLIAAFQKEYVRNNFSDEEKMNCRLYNVNHCDCPIGYSCSIGISFYNLDGSNFYELYHAADAALYKAKESGRNRYVCFQKPDQHQPSQSIVLLPPNGEALEN